MYYNVNFIERIAVRTKYNANKEVYYYLAVLMRGSKVWEQYGEQEWDDLEDAHYALDQQIEYMQKDRFVEPIGI